MSALFSGMHAARADVPLSTILRQTLTFRGLARQGKARRQDRLSRIGMSRAGRQRRAKTRKMRIFTNGISFRAGA